MSYKYRSVLLLFVVLVAACTNQKSLFKSTKADYQYEAGSAHVSVVSVMPWATIREELKPEFKNTKGNDVIGEVVPTTQSLATRILDSLKFDLQVNAPKETINITKSATERSKTDEKGSTTGTAESTSTAEESTVSGDLPTPAATPVGSVSRESKLPADVSAIDPFLKYHAAAALGQEIAVLNNYLDHAVTKEGYKAYLVTTSLTLLPLRRNMPYDVYMSLYFFPGFKSITNELEDQSIFVIPIIATQNFEKSTIKSEINTIREVSLAIRGIVNGVGAGAGIGSKDESLQAVAGNDTNALLTLARTTNNSVRARMGAAHQGSSRYAILPREHFVSFLLLSKGNISDVNLISRTQFVDVETGETLPKSRSRDTLLRDVCWTLDNYGYAINANCPALKGEVNDTYKPLEFLSLVQAGEYGVIKQCLGTRKGVPEKASRPYCVALQSDAMSLYPDLGSADYHRLTKMLSKILDNEIYSTTGKQSFDLPDL